MEIKTLYEDNNLLIVDKPAGLVMHPGAGSHEETLVDWFKNKIPQIEKLPWPEPSRPGIVHRLDKDTSGLAILAKNPSALEKLQLLFSEHKVTKQYLSLVFGKLEKKEGEIIGLISRDPNARRQQTAKAIHFDFEPGKAREAKTKYKVLKEYHYDKYDLSLVEATLDTGRMHQIRVHFKFIGHPVIGDQTYNIKHSRIVSKKLGLNRQFLHAYKLSFTHPISGQEVRAQSDLPDDLQNIILKLQ